MTDAGVSQTARGATPGRGFIRRGVLASAVCLLALVLLPFVFSSASAIVLMSQMGVFIVFALSYNMLLSETGLLSFGHASYFGLGGFATVHAIAAVQAGELWWPLELMPLIGGCAGLSLAFVFGLLASRRSGVAFAMITLGLGALVVAAAHILPGVFGGESGISANRVIGVTVLPVTYATDRAVYYLIAGWTLVSALAMAWLRHTPLGCMANAVRDNAERARFVGYNPAVVRLRQFALSGLFAGMAGALFAILFEIMTVANLGLVQSGAVLLMTYIGGVGAFAGPVIGAVLVTGLQTTLSQLAQGWSLYFGLLFIGMVMYAPGGIAGMLNAHKTPWRAGMLRRLLPAYAAAIVPAFLTLAGFVGVVEMGYQLSLAWQPSRPLTLFVVTVDATHIRPWLVATLMLCTGALALRWAVARVARRWTEVDQLLQARVASQ